MVRTKPNPKLQKAQDTLTKTLRFHPDLNDRQICWVLKAFKFSRYMALKARKALQDACQVRCLAKENSRGQLVKYWRLTR